MKKRIGVSLIVMLVVGMTSCTPAVDAEPTSSKLSNSATEDPADSTAEATETPAEEPETAEGDSERTVCEDAAFLNAATIPDQLANLGVPFYPCVHEMVAVTNSDRSFVGEYDTTHESIIIEMSITNQFDASDWEVTARAVEGDNAITQARNAEYTLVVAIGPSRTEGAVSSIHYTLRAE
ncbi:MAG: hypothetical protein ACTIJ6_06905 [Leucobacter sp.]